jgi:DnaJ-class molecular chaperone
MKIPNIKTNNWAICPQCDGLGKKIQKPSKKSQRLYQRMLVRYEKLGKT